MRSCSLFFIVFLSSIAAIGQRNFQWAKDGKSYYVVEGNELVSYQLPGMDRKVMLDKSMLTLSQDNGPMEIVNFSFSRTSKKYSFLPMQKKYGDMKRKGIIMF